MHILSYINISVALDCSFSGPIFKVPAYIQGGTGAAGRRSPSQDVIIIPLKMLESSGNFYIFTSQHPRKKENLLIFKFLYN